MTVARAAFPVTAENIRSAKPSEQWQRSGDNRAPPRARGQTQELLFSSARMIPAEGS